jgi:hypothetical protein
MFPVSVSKSGYYSYFKVLATVDCVIDKESNHIPAKEKILILSYKILKVAKKWR